MGPGTKRRIIGRRKNFWPRLKFSTGGSLRNPYTKGLFKTKSLLPSVITGMSGLGARRFWSRIDSVMGMGARREVKLYVFVEESPASAVVAEAKQNRNSFVFIKNTDD